MFRRYCHFIASPTNASSYTWNFPASWQVVGNLSDDTLKIIASDTGYNQVAAIACNSCGCSPPDTFTVYVVDSVITAPVLVGPSFVCIGDTAVFYVSGSIPQGFATSWQVPPSWTIVSQTADSIIVIPDTTDGVVKFEICTPLNCACTTDSLIVTVDSCLSFCIAIGGSGDDYGYSITATSDGGIAIAGYTTSWGAGFKDIYVLKLDLQGNIVWTTVIGGSNDDVAMSIAEDRSNFLLIGGYTSSFGLGGGGMYFAKLNPSGNLMSNYTYGGGGNDWGYGIVSNYQNNYLLAGETVSFSTGLDDVYAILTDSNGNIIWTLSIGGNSLEGVKGWKRMNAITTSDSGFLIVAETRSYGAGNSDFYAIKITKNGNVQWSSVIGGSNSDEAYAATETPDGGYVIVGRTGSFGQGGYDIYVVKLDSLGNLIWSKAIGGPNNEEGWDVAPTYDNGYIIVGETNSYGSGGYDVYLVKIDSLGNLQWTRTIGGPSDDHGRAILPTNQGFVIAGATASFGSGGYDVYVIKTDRLGNLSNCTTGCIVNTGGSSTNVASSTSSGHITRTGGNKVAQSPNLTSGGILVAVCQ